MSNDEEEQSNIVKDLRPDKRAELFLEAVLAEYKRLAEQAATHQKNTTYLFAVLVAGVSTILGVYGFATASFLIIPVFVSACSLLIMNEVYCSNFIAFFINNEIKNRKLSKLFSEDSPITWEHYHQSSRYFRLDWAIWLTAFAFSFSISFAALVTVTLSTPELFSDSSYQVVYYSGWTLLIAFTLLTALGIRAIYEMRNTKQG